MSREHSTSPSDETLQPQEGFGFTEEERLHNSVSDERLRALLDDPQTTVHKVDESANSYGEFLFITMSRPVGDKRECATFFGYGFDENRERWFFDEWRWHRANQVPETMGTSYEAHEARELLQQRRTSIAPFVTEDSQSKHGRFFEMLADLTDDDGALAEMEDLDDFAYGLLGDFFDE